jgi:hypothetical protein
MCGNVSVMLAKADNGGIYLSAGEAQRSLPVCIERDVSLSIDHHTATG